MERIVPTLLAFSLFVLSLPSIAGVVYLPPKVDDEQGRYPESRFGQAPQKAVDSEYSSFISQSQSAAERSQSQSRGRSPAGLLLAPAPPGGDNGLRVINLKHKSPSDLIPSKTKGIQEVAVIAGDLGFFPNTIFVTRDVPVRLFVTGASKDTLCIMMDTFNVRKQIRSKRIEEITFVPKLPGQYRFYCPVNGMEGTLVVKEIASKRKPASRGRR